MCIHLTCSLRAGTPWRGYDRGCHQYSQSTQWLSHSRTSCDSAQASAIPSAPTPATADPPLLRRTPQTHDATPTPTPTATATSQAAQQVQPGSQKSGACFTTPGEAPAGQQRA